MNDKALITEAITDLNRLRDFGMWEKMEGLFIDRPFVDDEALTKEQASHRTVKQLISSWRRELKNYFYATRHTVKKMTVGIMSRKEAEVTAETAGQYFISDKGERYVLTVLGTYTYKMVKKSGIWKIGEISFKLTEQFIRPVGFAAA